MKFKGTFNWYGEIIELYTTTTNAKRAKTFLFIRLADLLDRDYSSVRNYYLCNEGDRYKIEEV